MLIMLCIDNIEQKIKKISKQEYQLIFLLEERYGHINIKDELRQVSNIINKFEDIQCLNVSNKVAIIYHPTEDNSLAYDTIKYISTKVNKLLLVKF